MHGRRSSTFPIRQVEGLDEWSYKRPTSEEGSPPKGALPMAEDSAREAEEEAEAEEQEMVVEVVR